MIISNTIETVASLVKTTWTSIIEVITFVKNLITRTVATTQEITRDSADIVNNVNNLINDKLPRTKDSVIINGFIRSLLKSVSATITASVFTYLILTVLTLHVYSIHTNKQMSDNTKSIRYFEAIEETKETVSKVEKVAIEAEDVDSDEDDIEISNMSEFLLAIEHRLANNAAQATGVNVKTIEYNATSKKCRKGYRRVGDKCVLISYLKATNNANA